MSKETLDKIDFLFNYFKKYFKKKFIMDKETEEKFKSLCDNFREFLKEKNRRYQDSALTPIKVFSKNNAVDQICSRADDKISRILASTELKKNDICDLFGYLALLMIKNNWTDFEDLLD